MLSLSAQCLYIIPIPAGAPAGIAGASSLIFATTDSVVNNVEATDVAFCNALLVTLAGSMIPFSSMSTYSPCNASNPFPISASFTLLTITAPSRPALTAIWNNGASNALRMMFAPVFSSPSKSATFSAAFLDAWI